MISTGPSILRLANYVNGYPFGPSDLGTEGIPVVRIRQLIDPAAVSDSTTLYLPKVEINDGDIIFAWSGSLAVRRWNRGRAFLNQHLFRVDPTLEVDPAWLFYVLVVACFRLEPLMHGSAMTHVTRDMLQGVTVAVPSLEKQRSISSALDAETARIDALIGKKQNVSNKLIERREATTVAAVSGQLTGYAEMVESSLPWLKDIPAGWETALVRLVARLGSGHTPSRERPEWWTDCTIPWITTGEVRALRSDRVEYVSDTREKISEVGLANSAAELHPKDTVVLCRTASAGYSGIMETDMATSQDFATWTCGPRLRPRFLLLCLRAMRQDLLGRLAMGSTHKTIYMPDIRSIRIPLPSVEEQDRIVNAAWGVLTRIDTLTEKIEQQIQLLKEHRQALITAAVTGELEIPGVRA